MTSIRAALLSVSMGLAVLASACSSETAAEDDGATEDAIGTAACPGPIPLSKAIYPDLPSDYEPLDASKKQALLWTLLSESEYAPGCTLPTDGIGYVAFAATKPLTSLDVTFNRSNDQLPPGRKKFLHPYGSVATFEFIRDDAPGRAYTGILKPGGRAIGVLRIGLGGDERILGFTPGMALKFLIDGQPSVNLNVMHSLMGQGKDRNILRHDFTNELPLTTEALDKNSSLLDSARAHAINGVLDWFKVFYPTPLTLHVDHLSYRDEHGARSATPAEAHQLIFRPNRDLTAWGDDASNIGVDYRDVLRKLSPGTDLYDVYAKDSPTGAEAHIGKIKTTSKIVPSKWGDYRLYFRHNDWRKNQDAR